MRLSESWPARLGLGALLLLGVFAWAPATFPGYWQSLEGFVPIFNLIAPAPLASVATAPDLWRGTGSAAFLFAQPFLPLGPTAAVRAAFVLCFILGGLGIYQWLLPDLGDLAAGLAGLLYMLLPSFLATVYVRGSLSDATILAWLPVAFAGLAVHARRRIIPGAAVAVIAIIWMWRTQAGLAALATILLLLYVLWVERNWVSTAVVLVAGAAGWVSLAPEWPVASLSPVNFQDHFIDFYQFFGVTWNVAASVPGWQDGFPFQLGFAALGFSIITLWGWGMGGRRGQPRRVHRLLCFAFVATAVLMFLSLTFSAPLWATSRAGRLLTYPWQTMLLAAPLLAVTAGALPAVVQDLHTPSYWLVLVSMVVLSSYGYLTTTFTQVIPPERPLAIFGTDQLAILDAHVTESTNPNRARLDITWQVLQPLAFDYNVFFQSIQGEGEGEQVLAQLDAQPLGSERPATDWRPGEIATGSYQLELPAGHTPQRYYFGFYDWQDNTRLPVDRGLDDKLVLYAN